MSTLKTLFAKLSSNFQDLGNVSQYFNEGTVCYGGRSISELKSEVVNYRKNTGECVGSVCSDPICYPNPVSVSDYGIINDSVSNQIIVSVLLGGEGFQRIYNAIRCGNVYNMVYDVYPIGLQYPNKIPGKYVSVEKLIRPSVIPVESGTVTLGTEFIVLLVDRIIHILTEASKDHGFNHGNLTHESIGFNNNGDVIVCDLRYSSMSFVSGTHIVRVEPKVNPIKKFLRGDFIPSSDSGFYRLDGYKNMNGLEQYRSLDYYTFIVSCLSIDYIFNTVMSNYILKAIIFDSVFDTKDISKVYQVLFNSVESGRPLTYANILNLLRTCTLRCNAMEITLERLGKLKNIL